jgi:anthranilate/para-aminobenzoate synthase component II
MGPGPEALGHLDTQLDAAVGLGKGQLLGVCIGHHELNTLETRLDHVVHGVTTGTPDTEHHNPGLQFRRTRSRQLNSHRPKPFEPTSANRPLGAFVDGVN